LETGAVFMLFPGVWHRYRPMAETGWSYHWAHFDGEYTQHLVQNELISPNRPILDVGLNGQVLRPFLSLIESVQSSPPGLQQLAAAKIIEILGSVLSAPPPTAIGDELKAILRSAREVIEQQAHGSVDLRQLASSFGLSYSYFRNTFRDYVGVSPYQFYLNLRLERAKELLCCTDMTIQEIAMSLEFDNQNYFSRLFRKKTGQTPSDWRSNS